MTKKITILGSTGSIGTQALEVIDKLNGQVEVVALSAGNNISLISQQIKKYSPTYVCVSSEDAAKTLKKDFPDLFEKAKLGMQKTIEVEKNNADVLTQGEAFAEMIIDSIETITPLTEAKRNFIKGVSIWLCLMDAIDDLDKDIKKYVYNPLRYTEELNKSSKKELINSSYFEINKYIEKIKELLIDVRNTSQYEKVNEALDLYLNKIIPFQTNRVLTN